MSTTDANTECRFNWADLRYVATTKTADGRQYTGKGKTYPEAIKNAQRAKEAAISHTPTGKGNL